jgi:hypothetical protein
MRRIVRGIARVYRGEKAEPIENIDLTLRSG